MNKLLATLVAGTFAAVSTAALAQNAVQKEADKIKADVKAAQSTDKAKAFSEKEKQLQDLSRNSPNPADQKANVDKSKMDPKMKTKYDEKAAQAASSNSPNPADQKANVAASKAASPKRNRLPNVKDLTPAERAQLMKDLQAESKP